MIEYAIRARLAAVTAVTDLVGGATTPRIYADELTQEQKFPAVTVLRVSGRPEHAMSGPVGHATALVQVDCWEVRRPGKDSGDVTRRLAEAVRSALDGWTGTAASVGVQRVLLRNRRPAYDDTTETYRETLDFDVAYAES